MRFTFTTPGGREIDIVDGSSEAIHSIYILKRKLPELLARCEELGISRIDKKTYTLLRSEKLIRRNQ